MPTQEAISDQEQEVRELITGLFYQETEPGQQPEQDNPDRIKGPFRWHAVCIDADGRLLAFANGGNGGDR